MSWSTRYATTKKSIKELKSILPDGWVHAGFTQPDGNSPTKEFYHWMPPQQRDTVYYENGSVRENQPLEPLPNARRNRVKTPDMHIVMNPMTGNSAMIYDHSKMNEDTRHVYWNPIDHGRLINRGLKRLDKRANGVNLRLIRHSNNSRNILWSPGCCSAQDSKNIDVGLPIKNSVGPHFEVLDHELGHVRMHRNPNELTNFAKIIMDHFFSENNWTHTEGHKKDVLSYIKDNPSNAEDTYHAYDAYNSKAPEILHPIVRETATDGYGASNMLESHACHHHDYLNGSKNPLTQRLGKELGWDKPIQ